MNTAARAHVFRKPCQLVALVADPINRRLDGAVEELNDEDEQHGPDE